MEMILKSKDLVQLGLDKNIVLKLEDKLIFNVYDLWIKTRKDLKELNFLDSEINHIRIKLQLSGLDLNKKTYI